MIYLHTYSNTIKTIFQTKIYIQFKTPCIWMCEPAEIQARLHRFSKSDSNHQERHNEIHPGNVRTCVRWKQVYWKNGHHFRPERIPQGANSGLDLHQARLRRRRWEDPSPDKGGPLLRRRWRLGKIEEDLRRCIKELHNLPPIPYKDISHR